MDVLLIKSAGRRGESIHAIRVDTLELENGLDDPSLAPELLDKPKDLLRLIRREVTSGCRLVLWDLGAPQWIGSPALGMLLFAQRRMQANGGMLIGVRPPPRIRNILDVVSSIPTVPICDTLEEALQLFRNATIEQPTTPGLFAWTTDPHLNAVDQTTIHKFCIAVRSSGAACLLLTGDIGEANSVVLWLEYLAEHIGIPIYFVLGNHDYYGSSVAAVRQQMRELDHPLLHWMPEAGCVQLDTETALVGHDGWGDARIGDFDGAPIMTEFLAVEELVQQIDREDLLDGFQQRDALKRKLQELGDDAAATLAPALLQAAAEYSRVIVLTHYPPFREASVHDGSITSDDWLAVTTCKAMGDLLLGVARANEGVSIDVLCGHTHREAAVEILPNLYVHTGRGGYERLYLGWVHAEKEDIRVELPRLLEG